MIVIKIDIPTTKTETVVEVLRSQLILHMHYVSYEMIYSADRIDPDEKYKPSVRKFYNSFVKVKRQELISVTYNYLNTEEIWEICIGCRTTDIYLNQPTEQKAKELLEKLDNYVFTDPWSLPRHLS